MTGKNVKASKMPFFIFLFIIASLFACYYFWPSNKGFVNESYQVLSSSNKERISNWVSQFVA